MTKYERYQDYVIKNGSLVGEFEQMYQDFEDPWEQTTREAFAAEKKIAINGIQALGAKKVIEFGCGLGHFSNEIQLKTKAQVLGIDISKSAIEKAKAQYSNCAFSVGDILDEKLITDFNPEIIIFAEITWYILEKLDPFLSMMKQKLPHVYFIHLLTTYPEGEQQYGKEFFQNMEQILSYFKMNYLEYAEIHKPLHGNCKRSYFLGRYSPLDKTYLL